MSKYATPDKKSIIYNKKNIPIPKEWRIVFKDEDDGVVHEGDLLFTMSGVFKSIPALEADHGLKEVGEDISSRICVIRRIVAIIK